MNPEALRTDLIDEREKTLQENIQDILSEINPFRLLAPLWGLYARGILGPSGEHAQLYTS